MLALTKVTGVACLAWWVATMTVQIFSCHPIHGFWDTSIHSHCINRTGFYIGVAAPNISIDLVMIALPIRTVWHLQLSTGQKIGLLLTFMTGGL